MMRVFLLFAALTWLTLSVSAQNSKALDLARKTIGGNVHLAEGNANKSGTLNPQYYFYVNDERAFALVSADGEKLLGYSKEPSYDAERGLPPQLKAILNAYSERMLSGENKSEEIDNKEWLCGDVVEPLIKSIWDQDGIFNQKTPIIDGEHTPTGCTATAFAQVIKYFGTADETLAEIPAYTTTTHGIEMPAIPAGQKFQWDLMLDDIFNDDRIIDTLIYEGDMTIHKRIYPDEAIEAMSNFMLCVGCMCRMDYDLKGSSAYTEVAATGMINYLGYKGFEKIRCETRESKMGGIIHNLMKKIPCVASGFPEEDDGVGHAFIFDGIDADGLLHVNWGWGGSHDGYFNDLELRGFTRDFSVISGFIKPDTEDDTYMIAPIKDKFLCAIYDRPWNDPWGEEGLVATRNEKGSFEVCAKADFDKVHTPEYESYDPIRMGCRIIRLMWARKDGTVKEEGWQLVPVCDDRNSEWNQCIMFTDDDFDEEGTLTAYLEEELLDGRYVLCRNALRYPLKLKRVGDEVYMVNVPRKKQIEIPEPDLTEYIYNGKEQTYSIPENDDYVIIGNKQTNAGEYSVSVRFKEYNTCVWSDGTKGPKEYKFEIKKAVPTIETESYEVPSRSPLESITLPDNYNWYEPNEYLDKTGVFEFDAYYEDPNGNYERVDNIKIKVTVVIIISSPAEDKTTFVYNGKEQTYTPKANYSSERKYYTVTGNKQTDAGEYTVTIKLNDPYYRWNYGHSRDLQYTFVINKAVPEYTVPSEPFVIEPGQKLSDITLPENFYWVAPETVVTEEGTSEFEAYYEHPDTKNYEKVEGIKIKVTVSTVPVEINKVTIPEADKTEFVYNGKEQTYVVAESEYYTVTGNKQTDAGEYTVTIKLTDTEKNAWSDGTTSDKTFSFVIKKAVPEYTLPEGYSLYVDQKLSDITLPENFYWVAPETVMTEAGTFEYAAYYELSDTKNYEKVEGIKIKVTVSEVPVEINKVTVPEADKTEFVYNGKEQTYAVAESEYYTVTGNKQTDAGEYTVTVKLTDTEKNAWSDGTTSDKTFTFVIKKAVPEFTLPEGYSLNVDQKLSDITLPENFYWVAPETVLTEAGTFEYAAYYELSDTKNYEKVEGIKIKVTVSTVPIVPVEINKVDIPEADKTEFVYNGNEQTYTVAESEYYTVTGNKQTDAGEYTVTVKLTDTEKNAWSDGSTSDKTFSFVIKKAIPEYTLPEGYSLNVDQKLSDITLPENFYWVAPETVMTEAGTFEYAAYYEPADTKNYEKVESIKIKVQVLSANVNVGNVYILDDIAEWGVKSGEALVLVCEDGVQSNVTYELVIEGNPWRFFSEIDSNGNIIFEGTKTLAPGVYEGNVVITVNDSKLGAISKSVAISFMIDYPASYIINPWDDVLAVCNTDKTFASYQWYKDGQKIENATGQYYRAVGGVNGVYTCLVENEEGVKVFVTPDQYIREAALDIKVTSSDTNTLNVEIEGLTEDELKTAKLYVHTITGQLAWAATKLEKSNSITLESGEYVVSVISGTRMASCVVVLK